MLSAWVPQVTVHVADCIVERPLQLTVHALPRIDQLFMVQMKEFNTLLGSQQVKRPRRAPVWVG